MATDPKAERRKRFLARAHELCAGFMHIECGTLSPDHHPVEEKIADELEKAFIRGCHAGRRGGYNRLMGV